MARPSKFSQALLAEICERLAKGEPLAVICRDDHMPAHNTISDWKKVHANVSDAIACAREEGFDAIATRTRETARGQGDSAGDVQRDKLIIDTDLKLLAKWDPKRYGEKVTQEHTGPGGGPVVTEVVRRIVRSDP